MTRRALLAFLWAVTLALCYLGPGERLAGMIEGMEPGRLPLWPTLLAAVLFLVTLSLTLGAAPRVPRVDAPAASGRRIFLVRFGKIAAGFVAGGAAVMLRLRGWATVTGPAIQVDVAKTDPNPRPEWAGARVRSYRRLGRTGFEVSDISLGSG
ncbi:MAG: hypothetical protein ACREQY_05825, partial [Candidatus Binatia bacterium]